MNAVATLLILSSAVVHASWNFVVKRSGTSSPTFLYMYSAVATVLYLPLAAVVFVQHRPALTAMHLVFAVGTIVLHSFYFLVLQHAYQRGDLSVVYPLSRGTGPLLATVAAITLLGERPSGLGLAAGATVIAGVLVIATTGTPPSTAGRPGPAHVGGRTGPAPDGAASRIPAGVTFGVLTGVFVAMYTVWDAYAVGEFGFPPVLLEWSDNLGRTLVFAPFALKRPAALRQAWREQRSAAIAIGALAPLAYILALTAYTMAPVSYVAPAREISIVIGTLLGGRLLQEAYPGRRALAALVVVIGVVGLTLA